MKRYIFLSMVALLISGCNLTPEEYNQFKYSLAISQVQSTCPNDTVINVYGKLMCRSKYTAEQYNRSNNITNKPYKCSSNTKGSCVIAN